MRALHVALIVKNTPASFARDDRNMGMFSYAVPEFTWEHFSPGKGNGVNTRELKRRGFDLVFHEDGGSWGDYRDNSLPCIYYAIDSTLSDENHFTPRFKQAQSADLVLVDHDRLERFQPCGKPVRRLSYCVNDKLFHPADKTLDVDFQCSGAPERRMYRTLLSEFCKARGLSYQSGAVPLGDYARNMNRAKVVVNIPRTPNNRPHRVFDAMASGAALVTLKLPDVSGECRKTGQHYLEVAPEDIAEKAAILVENGTWQLLALEGRKLVEQRHTWAARARELREMIKSELSV